jgi:NTP pyrophosphatase (non-canonical NTP hydrolase)
MTKDAEYTFMAHRFNRLNDAGFDGYPFSDNCRAQFDVFQEEVDELEQAFEESDYHAVKEEMADVLVTIFVLADRMDIDIDAAYEAKMLYNLSKSGERDENGKIMDDARTEKPDFSEMEDGFKP